MYDPPMPSTTTRSTDSRSRRAVLRIRPSSLSSRRSRYSASSRCGSSINPASSGCFSVGTSPPAFHSSASANTSSRAASNCGASLARSSAANPCSAIVAADGSYVIGLIWGMFMTAEDSRRATKATGEGQWREMIRFGQMRDRGTHRVNLGNRSRNDEPTLSRKKSPLEISRWEPLINANER